MERMANDSRLKEMLPSYIGRLTPQERAVYDYLIKEEDRILSLDIQDIASGAGVSRSTVVRFCKFLGFNGLKDFKIEYESGKKQSYRKVKRITKGTKMEDISPIFTHAVLKIAEHDFEGENINSILRLAERLRGTKSAKVICSDEFCKIEAPIRDAFSRLDVKTVFEFTKLNKNTSLCDKLNILIYPESYGSDMSNLIKRAKEKGAYTALFTSTPQTWSTKNVDSAIILNNERIIDFDKYELFRVSLGIYMEFLRLLVSIP